MTGPIIVKYCHQSGILSTSGPVLYISKFAPEPAKGPGEAICPPTVTAVCWRASATLANAEWLWPEDPGAEVLMVFRRGQNRGSQFPEGVERLASSTECAALIYSHWAWPAASSLTVNQL